MFGSKRNLSKDPIDITSSDQHRNTAIIHSLYREWSAEGQEERNQSFLPLINALQTYLPITHPSLKYTYKVLVPGSGLGRLPLEIASLGYCCQGNEYSAFMAAPANFILNAIQTKNSYKINPWIDRVCNVIKSSDILESVYIPDQVAYDMLHDVNTSTTTSSTAVFPPFSMGIGDFVSSYNIPQEYVSWDAVVTCFFIDTAPVVFDYIETIYNILKPGAIWTNIGMSYVYHMYNSVGYDVYLCIHHILVYTIQYIKHVVLSIYYTYT